MEYQVEYYWGGIGPGAFSADDRTFRLSGYATARRKKWVGLIVMLILWPMLMAGLMFVNLTEALQSATAWTRVIIAGLVGGIWGAVVGVGFNIVRKWPASTTTDEYETRFVTRLMRHGKRISFDLPNPLKPGQFLHVKFRAKGVAEAEQIVEALQQTQSSAPQISSIGNSGRTEEINAVSKFCCCRRPRTTNCSLRCARNC
jgi:hypothetical protein